MTICLFRITCGSVEDCGNKLETIVLFISYSFQTSRSLIDWCRPGITLRLLHERSVKMLCEGLVDLGLAPSMPLARNRYRAFYPHSVGHWLGMDTHDTPSISHDRPLERDVHLTIEPGIYIPDDPRYGELAGIGVRIEDVILINEGPQCTVLSRSAPTDSASIEEYMTAQ